MGPESDFRKCQNNESCSFSARRASATLCSSLMHACRQDFTLDSYSLCVFQFLLYFLCSPLPLFFISAFIFFSHFFVLLPMKQYELITYYLYLQEAIIFHGQKHSASSGKKILCSRAVLHLGRTEHGTMPITEDMWVPSYSHHFPVSRIHTSLPIFIIVCSCSCPPLFQFISFKRGYVVPGFFGGWGVEPTGSQSMTCLPLA